MRAVGFPHEFLVLGFSPHKHTYTASHARIHPAIQIYFVKHFPVFPYSKLQFRTPRCPYTHTHTQLYAHTLYYSKRAASSLSVASSLSLSLLTRTAAGAQTNRRLLPRLARKSILQAVGEYQNCINLPSK